MASDRGRGGRAGGRGGAGGRGDGRRERMIVGRHPVREVLRAGGRLHRVHLDADREPDALLEEVARLARDAGVPIDTVPRGTLDGLAPDLVHQGVVATGPPLATVPVDALLERAAARGQAPLLVALDGVTDPHNLGAIARSAEAVGAHGLLVPGRRVAPVTAVAEKAAAGALAHLPVATVTNLVRALAQLHERGVWSLGLDGERGTPLAGHALATEPCVLVVGAEGDGLSRLTRERCDALVALPMRGQVGSLNASVAAAVALYGLLAAREHAIG